MPRLLLIQPRSEANGLQHILAHRFVPLALMTIGALAEREGWQVEIVDENAQTLPTFPPGEGPDLVGITVWTLYAPRAYNLADRFRAEGIPVVLGGVHASIVPGEALDHADAVVVGEAESVLARVLADTLDGRLSGVYRGSWDDLGATPTLTELLPFYDRFPVWRYWPQYSIQSTRGCRYNCEYCSVIRINGRGQRHRDPEQVVAELELRLRRNRLTSGLFFTDDDFGSDLEYTERLLHAMVDAELKLSWVAQTSIGIARNESLLRLARKAGCTIFFLGLESITRASLLQANKKNRPSEYAELLGRMHDAGIAAEGSFIFGFDADTLDVFRDTVEFADEIGIDLAFFNILTPLPGTGTFSTLWDQGRIVDTDWGHYNGLRAVFEPAGMTVEQLEAGMTAAYHDFYTSGRRRRRARRQFRTFPPDFAAVLSAINASFAREYRDLGHRRSANQPFCPRPEHLAQLAEASRAPAAEVIWRAADLAVPVAIGR